MKHPNRTTRLLSLLFLAAAAQTGCTDSIEVFPHDDGEQGSDGGSPEHPTQSDAASQVDAAHDGASESDGSTPLDAGTCTLRPSGRVLSPCKRAYQSCAISGPVFSEATFIGCTDAQGIGGNPQLMVATCEHALLAESGQTCSETLSCMGASEDTCCVRRATCEKDASLMLAEVCVASCERTPLLPGPTVHSCAEVAVIDAEPESMYGSHSTLPNLVGLPCVGDFACDPETSYGFSVFCGAGRLQLLTFGSQSL